MRERERAADRWATRTICHFCTSSILCRTLGFLNQNGGCASFDLRNRSTHDINRQEIDRVHSCRLLSPHLPTKISYAPHSQNISSRMEPPVPLDVNLSHHYLSVPQYTHPHQLKWRYNFATWNSWRFVGSICYIYR
jgi:hypothetical protein